MSKQDDLEILECIYKNSKMASDSIKQVIPKCTDSKLKEYISSQQQHYNDDSRKYGQEIRKRGYSPTEAPLMARVMSKVGIAMKTAMDNSQSNIAKLMYDGTNMGIIDMAHTVNRHHGADEKLVSQAQQLLSMEEEYANGLKRFL